MSGIAYPQCNPRSARPILANLGLSPDNEGNCLPHLSPVRDTLTLKSPFAKLKRRGTVCAFAHGRRDLHDDGTTPDIVP